MRGLQGATNSIPKPGDYPLGSLESRAAARALLEGNQKRVRLIFYVIDKPLNLETSSCVRLFWPDGTLFEEVMLDGSSSNLTDEELDTFVATFPIEPARNSGYGQHYGSVE